ncbi:helix-turn-helix domain-containing protein [Salinarimonas rosea]|uniref:helix-turn-helix domain-containing protein n=1 Tax=Salinarimonas rosea TaxID=552063 RepID=UPI000417FFF5|nr:helix-turn-helix domain-containing protein [Salinarimonas rosea]
MTEPYHYRESGLDDVYLASGFRRIESGGRSFVAIDDIDGLHEAIGRHLVEETRRLTGAQFRFLRTELGLSQASLARLLDVSEQSVARWEKGKTRRVDAVADRLLRLLYAEHRGGDARVGAYLRRIADLEDEADRVITFAETEEGWEPTAPVAA